MLGCCLLDGSSRGGLWPRFPPLLALNPTTLGRGCLGSAKQNTHRKCGRYRAQASKCLPAKFQRVFCFRSAPSNLAHESKISMGQLVDCEFIHIRPITLLWRVKLLEYHVSRLVGMGFIPLHLLVLVMYWVTQRIVLMLNYHMATSHGHNTWPVGHNTWLQCLKSEMHDVVDLQRSSA